MEWNLRTFVRLFLLVGGVALFVTGAVGSDTLDVVLGVVAATLGAVGLLSEWNDTAN
ncbi:hypothetical protein [Natronobacterium texcoconense]|uniref:Uncharacterized protein n=1 Tax=Natronobacterium texcoconense TaxID=1095778 RepID=A0A1H1BVA6_NATTX|nr:hypothetical protein [Natronobacterium texcoconense]SDQ55839.1 hypothetical protein SAMN04489842_1168 [Natronobacterium texcoconense]